MMFSALPLKDVMLFDIIRSITNTNILPIQFFSISLTNIVFFTNTHPILFNLQDKSTENDDFSS